MRKGLVTLNRQAPEAAVLRGDAFFTASVRE
jgi:hypothetical protein